MTFRRRLYIAYILARAKFDRKKRYEALQSEARFRYVSFSVDSMSSILAGFGFLGGLDAFRQFTVEKTS